MARPTVVPLSSIADNRPPCWVLGVAAFCAGRPAHVEPADVYVCEFRLDRRQLQLLPLKMPIDITAATFELFSTKKPFKRSTKGLVPKDDSAQRSTFASSSSSNSSNSNDKTTIATEQQETPPVQEMASDTNPKVARVANFDHRKRNLLRVLAARSKHFNLGITDRDSSRERDTSRTRREQGDANGGRYNAALRQLPNENGKDGGGGVGGNCTDSRSSNGKTSNMSGPNNPSLDQQDHTTGSAGGEGGNSDTAVRSASRLTPTPDGPAGGSSSASGVPADGSGS